MDENTLKRSEYWDHDLYTPRLGATGNAQSYTDMQRYLLPMDQIRNTACLTWGVAVGLAVQAPGGPGGVRISPGTAIDGEGHVIVLRAGGAAVVDPAADPDQIDDILTVPVADDGVVLGTAKVSGDCLLTVTWLEVLQQESPENPHVLVHAPWIRLIDAKDFDDDGTQVVLALLTLDDGRVVTLSGSRRRLAGLPTGRLELRAVTETAGGAPRVRQRVMAEFAADPEGSVVLTLTSGGHLRHPLAIEGTTGDLVVHSTLRAQGNAEITGTLTAQATTEAIGALNVRGPLNTYGAVNAQAHVTARGGLEAYGLLARGFTQVRQDGIANAGVSFFQDGPNADRAFVGMADDNTVGVWCQVMYGWPLRINVANGETRLDGSQVIVGNKLDARGPLNVQGVLDAQGVLNAHKTFNALGVLNAQAAVNANAGLNAHGLDVFRRMRVRQAGDASAGLWFFQDGPNIDRAFIGMYDDNAWGLYSGPTGQWPLVIDLNTGEAAFASGGEVFITGNLDVRGLKAYFQNNIQVEGGAYIADGIDVRGSLAYFGSDDVRVHGSRLYVQNTLRVVGASSLEGGLTVRGPVDKPGGTFTIDHPLDPGGKYLSHSFVESPDMLNVYSGVAVTDDQGVVTVPLPDFFETLNRDHRFQVTPIGRLALVAVDDGVRNNAFTIRTDQPNVRVSWQVTGVRQDPWALAHPVVVERVKPEGERGLFLYPEEYGYAASMRITDPVDAAR
ncbi:hypothetical protein ACIBQ6_13315 [Nonomuraea sp. NPDC049655]|uniref:hypothetical protein n=1 Tax=Nonomuraea sp. NPDC049655 TaxID=3364355 RepID=UPI0037A7A4D1